MAHALNFMAAFAPAIEAGTKPLTLRMPRMDGRDAAPVGKPLRLYTGMRRPGCRLILETATLYRARIQLSAGGILCLIERGGEGPVRDFLSAWSNLDAGPERDAMNEAFARMDGFEGYVDLFNWHAAVKLDDIGCVTRELISWRTPAAGD